MSPIHVVMMKELIDLARDRRTVLISLLMGPILIVGLVVGMGAVMQKKTATQMEKTLEVPLIGAEQAPNLVAFLASHNIEASAPPADAAQAIAQQEADVVLRIADDYAAQWRAGKPALVEILFDSTRDDSRIPVARVSSVLAAYGQQAGALRLLARGIDPGAGRPLLAAQVDLATPMSRVGQALAFLPYFLIMSAFLGGAYLVIDVTAGERERQSLEPLLATPASRRAIMSGKILAACVFGVMSLVLMLAAFKAAFWLAPAGVKVDVSLLAMAKLLLILLPTVLFGTCLLTVISASVKSVKEAQSYMSLLFLVPMLPTFFLLISPVKNEPWMLTVPFLAQNQMIMMVLRGEAISLPEWALYSAVGLVIAAALWWVAARMYHREHLAVSG